MQQHVYWRTVVSMNYHCKNPTQRVALVQNRHFHHLIEVYFVLTMGNCSLVLNNNHSVIHSTYFDFCILQCLDIEKICFDHLPVYREFRLDKGICWLKKTIYFCHSFNSIRLPSSSKCGYDVSTIYKGWPNIIFTSNRQFRSIFAV